MGLPILFRHFRAQDHFIPNSCLLSVIPSKGLYGGLIFYSWAVCSGSYLPSKFIKLNKVKNSVLGSTGHISSVEWPCMSTGYWIEQHRHGTFPSWQKALLESAVLESCLTCIRLIRNSPGWEFYLSKCLDEPDYRTSSELYPTTLNLYLLAPFCDRLPGEPKTSHQHYSCAFRFSLFVF